MKKAAQTSHQLLIQKLLVSIHYLTLFKDEIILVEKTPTEVVIDCNGVGYHINISLHTFSLIPDSENLKLYTFLQVKEDSHSLFGFVEKQEREL